MTSPGRGSGGSEEDEGDEDDEGEGTAEPDMDAPFGMPQALSRSLKQHGPHDREASTQSMNSMNGLNSRTN